MATPWPRPTLTAIASRMKGYIVAQVTGSDLSLRRHVLRVVSDAVSMGIHTLYGFVDYVARQILPTTADEDNLASHATRASVPRLAAAASTGTWVFTGTPATAIPAGTAFARSDGTAYTTDALGTVGGGGSVNVVCTAAEAGTDGNCAVNTTATLTAPIAGINSTVTAFTGGSTGGTDEEDVEDWRARILDRWRNPPQGGAATDYVQWAQAAGADRAWVEENYTGAGTVAVWFTVEGGPIPSGAQVTAVDTYIQARRPLCADVTVAAPIALTQAFTIHVSPDTAAIRTAIEAELDALLLTYQGGDTMYLSQIHAAISQAAGEEYHTMAVPAADVVIAINRAPEVGVITWT